MLNKKAVSIRGLQQQISQLKKIDNQISINSK
jgi:hypothetical protein